MIGLKNCHGNIWNWLLSAIQKVKEFGSNIAKKGKEGAVNLFNNIVNTIKNLPKKMLEIGKNIVQGIWNGINNAKDWVLDKIKSFANGLLDGIKGVFGIHSPSTVFRDQIGDNLAKGIGVGFLDTMKDVSNEMANAIPTDFDTAVNMNVASNMNASKEEINYNSMVSAFKQAIKEMKIELNDREVGNFVDRRLVEAM